jgi:1-deoxy-D-xylulose-5-phosphate synthase
VKSLITKQQNVFEGMNIRYFGPVDGHNVIELVHALRNIKDMRGPKMLHIHTTKGKGFASAEENPTEWHAPGLFDAETGERFEGSDEGKPPRFQDVFGHTVLELAKQNKKIVGVTPAMPTGCSLNIMMEKLPCRCFDVGIAEGHAVTFSGGMAKDGLVPFCNIYSSFLQRAYDNIIHDVAIQRLNVVLCIDRGGLVGEDGATHHGVFDLAYLSCIPNMVVAAPSDELELRNMMFTALQCGVPFAIRYPRGAGCGVAWRDKAFEQLPVGKGRVLREGSDVALLALGKGCQFAMEAAQLAQEQGVSVAVYDLRYAKPLDEELVAAVGAKFDHIITVEDGSLRGGVGEAVVKMLADKGVCKRVTTLGVGDKFVEQGTVAELYRECGYDAEGILKAILEKK